MARLDAPVRACLNAEADQVQDGVWRGTVFSQEGNTTAYIKLLPRRAFMVECLAAMLGRAHGVPVPLPMLVLIHDATLLRNCPTPEWQGWAFGSAASSAPSLERLTRDHELSCRLLRSWKGAIDGAVFDCLIANEDRTRKNVLWSDGPDGVSLIDHDDALPTWAMDNPRASTQNQLLDLLIGDDNELNRHRQRKQALLAATPYGRTDWSSLWTDEEWIALVSDAEQLEQLAGYVLERVNHLPYLLETATRSPQHSLPDVGRLAIPRATA